MDERPPAGLPLRHQFVVKSCQTGDGGGRMDEENGEDQEGEEDEQEEGDDQEEIEERETNAMASSNSNIMCINMSCNCN